MPNENSGSYIGLLSFLSFGFSVIAAVLAIDMYRLLRTGEYGRTWRLLIITCVMFALMQVLRMGDYLNWTPFNSFSLSQIVELAFVIALAYTFYLQRRVFTLAAKFRQDEGRFLSTTEPQDNPDHEKREEEWHRLAGYYAGYQENEENTRLLSYSEAQAEADDDIEWSPAPPPARSLPTVPPTTPTTPKPQP